MLDWSTAQEQNNKYFTIERSADGINYNYLAKVNSAGTSTVLRNYHLTDGYPLYGISYYRLSQTDYDGNTGYFSIRRVNNQNSGSFTCSMNALGAGRLRLSIHNAVEGPVSMRILDVSGREVIQETFSMEYIKEKDITLQPGVYVLLMINMKGEKISNKIKIE